MFVKSLSAEVVELDFSGDVFGDQLSNVKGNFWLVHVLVDHLGHLAGVEGLRGSGKVSWNESLQNFQRLVPVFQNADDRKVLVDILNKNNEIKFLKIFALSYLVGSN